MLKAKMVQEWGFSLEALKEYLQRKILNVHTQGPNWQKFKERRIGAK